MKNKQKYFDFTLLALLLAALLPFFALSFYNIPSADDLSYLNAAKNINLYKNISNYYFGWGGRYFSSLIIFTNPLVYGWELGYKLIPVFTIVLLYIGLLLLVRSFLKNHFTKYYLNAMILLALIIQLFPSPVEALYWISGSLTYTIPYIILLFLIFILKHGWQSKLILILIGLCAFILSGTNEVMMLLTFEMLLFFVLLNFVLKKTNLKLLIAFLFSFAGMVICIIAPGNYRRLDFFPLHGQIFDSVLSSIFSFIRLSVHIFTEPALWIILLIVFIHGAQKNIRISEFLVQKKYVILSLFASLLILISMYFPGYFAMGIAPPPRIHNCISTAMVLLLIVNAAILGNYYGLTKPSSLIATSGILTKWLTIISVIFLFTGIQKRPGESLEFTSNITNAWNDLLFEAAPYQKEMNERLEKISIAQKDKVDTLTLKPFTHKPSTIFYIDITENPRHWINISFSEYFHLNCVKLQNENPHDANISGKGN